MVEFDSRQLGQYLPQKDPKNDFASTAPNADVALSIFLHVIVGSYRVAGSRYGLSVGDVHRPSTRI